MASAIGELADVIWIGLFQPGYKLSNSPTFNGVQLYKLRLET
jgi:hypothetical protein